MNNESDWCYGTSGWIRDNFDYFCHPTLFGAKKLPELSRSLGKSLGEFKKGQEGETPDDSMSRVEEGESDIQIESDLLKLIRT